MKSIRYISLIIVMNLAFSTIEIKHASAAILGFGNDTHDTATGLAWLDLTLTEGLGVSAALLANPLYRVAEREEVHQLFLNAGMTSVDNPPVFRASDGTAAQTLLGFLGTTFVSSSNGAQGYSRWSDSGNPESPFSDPFLAVRISDGAGGAFAGSFIGSAAVEAGTNDVGIWLVRDIAPVPLPAALPLFGTGLALLGFAGWRRRHAAPV